MSMGEQGLISVVDFLFTEYAMRLAMDNHTAFEPQAEALKSSEDLMRFRKFAKDYLTANRPTSLTHAEANYIVQLTNTKKFAISPELASAQGTMQPSPFLCVTGQETAREIAGSLRQGGMAGNFEQRAPAQSMERGSQGFNFDQPGSYQKPERP